MFASAHLAAGPTNTWLDPPLIPDIVFYHFNTHFLISTFHIIFSLFFNTYLTFIFSNNFSFNTLPHQFLFHILIY